MVTGDNPTSQSPATAAGDSDIDLAKRKIDRPPWWFVLAAFVTCVTVGLALGLMTAYVIDARNRIEHLQTQVCLYQQAVVRLINQLELETGKTVTPLIQPEQCP